MFNERKKHIKDRITALKRGLWDLELEKFTALNLREDTRQEYDQAKSRLSLLQAKIDSEKTSPTMEKGDIARLDDDKVRAEKEVERLQNKLRDFDIYIQGSKPCEAYREGVQGLNDKIDSARSMIAMAANYHKQL
jgi:predicted translin family RNA/ssDNA-binding protein